jgi:large subunit ribosomal protein L13
LTEDKSASQDVRTIDATGLIVGRMASVIAKRLLAGERIHLVNAGKAVFAGTRSSKLKEMYTFLEIIGMANPKYGPHHPRRPDNMLRRIVKGMLPMKKDKGRQAFRRLKVYISVPPKLVGSKTETIEYASVGRLRCGYVSLEKLAKDIGYRGK